MYMYLQKRGKNFNSFTSKYVIKYFLGRWCGGLKMWSGYFNNVKFVIMLLDNFNTLGRGQEKDVCEYVAACVW